jgi:hypothetical protein
MEQIGLDGLDWIYLHQDNWRDVVDTALILQLIFQEEACWMESRYLLSSDKYFLSTPL